MWGTEGVTPINNVPILPLQKASIIWGRKTTNTEKQEF